MSKDVFTRLLERLNQNRRKYPEIKEVFNFLKAIFTEEQAELASSFPLGAHSFESLIKVFGKKKVELERQLESMSKEGLIFVAPMENGEIEYSLVPMVPGLVEFQTMKRDKETTFLVSQMVNAVIKLAEPLFKEPELANEVIGTPGLRTLAIEKSISSDPSIADWEQITQILDKEDSFAVTVCACRYERSVEGDPCKIDNVTMDSCIYFGKVADYIIERKYAKRFTKKQVIDLLKTCEKQGLIHNINNFIGDSVLLCNCCGCCCNILRPMLAHRGIKTIAASNFLAIVESDSCSGCGECVDICQLKAITLKDEKACIVNSYCIGCGNCVSVCPTESMSLTRYTDNPPPLKPDNMVGLGV